MMIIAGALIALAGASGRAVEVRWDTAVLQFDDAGRVVALEDVATGRNCALPGHPFCRIQSDAAVLVPESIARNGDRVTFAFPGGANLTYRVVPGHGFSVWTVAAIEGIDTARIVETHLADLNLAGLRTVGSQQGRQRHRCGHALL